MGDVGSVKVRMLNKLQEATNQMAAEHEARRAAISEAAIVMERERDRVVTKVLAPVLLPLRFARDLISVWQEFI